MTQGEREDILRKLYPRYDGSQWVLWFQLEYGYIGAKHWCSGHMKLLDKDGSVLQNIPSYETITPYTEITEDVHQLAAAGSPCGYPLIFDSFEELCEVKELLLHWDISYIRHIPEYLPYKHAPCIKDDCIRYEFDFQRCKEENSSRWFFVIILIKTDPKGHSDFYCYGTPDKEQQRHMSRLESGLYCLRNRYVMINTWDPYRKPFRPSTRATELDFKDRDAERILFERFNQVKYLEGRREYYDRQYETLNAMDRHMKATIPECGGFTRDSYRQYIHSDCYESAPLTITEFTRGDLHELDEKGGW